MIKLQNISSGTIQVAEKNALLQFPPKFPFFLEGFQNFRAEFQNKNKKGKIGQRKLYDFVRKDKREENIFVFHFPTGSLKDGANYWQMFYFKNVAASHLLGLGAKKLA